LFESLFSKAMTRVGRMGWSSRFFQDLKNVSTVIKKLADYKQTTYKNSCKVCTSSIKQQIDCGSNNQLDDNYWKNRCRFQQFFQIVPHFKILVGKGLALTYTIYPYSMSTSVQKFCGGVTGFFKVLLILNFCKKYETPSI